MRQNQNQDTIELSSGQARTMTVETLIKHFNLVVKGCKFSTEDIPLELSGTPSLLR